MRYERYEDLIGKKLLDSIVSDKGVVLVPADTILTESHVEKLENFGIDIADISAGLQEDETGAETPDERTADAAGTQAAETESGPSEGRAVEAGKPAAPPPRIASAHPEAGELAKLADAKMREIEKLVLDTGKIPIEEVERSVLPAIREATQKRNIYKLFAELKAEGDFRFKHSIGVAFVASMLGRWLRLDENETARLTMGASLCDIGSVKLPSALVHKTTELQPHEYEILKQHTVIGYDLLKQSGVDERVALVALQHHEREDGSGYPARLKGPDIHPFAKIVALADVYLAMTSDRPQRPAMPFYQVIKELHGDIVRNRFDSAVGMTFLHRLMAAQVGSDIVLTDDRRGQIVLINANYPTSPLVSLGGEFLDLSKTNDVKIKEIVG
ncbi:HD-GYP domain-containing protein [Paenibacillus flagellatus]|uniref:HD-GYP domain-containing protein n=1 Tax=Paenibacillus flagellatus TaxID=2211139 RepID=A0A2V5KCB2_9BACL|nr:HD-GYP domain-containing protein [Paenibacillus flagellatus]PYI57231.1 HD-GYP domain-containing protein [Paenibacillus flagellatus]